MTAPPVSIFFVRPVKKKVTYTGRVTVCIAAACLEDGEPRIVLCSDTRLSYGEWGATDRTVKLDVIGRGWCVQFSNREDSARELIQRIKEWLRRTDGPETTHSVLMAIDGAVKEFRSSPLFTPGCCQLLITGFVSDEAVILSVQDDGKRALAIQRHDSYAVIGSGSTITMVLLNCREYNRSEQVNNAIYLTYEAKRFSEKADGVGPLTSIVIQAPGPPESFDRANVRIMGPVGVLTLERVFGSIGLKQQVNVKSWPKECFLSLAGC